jgi:hypothetical protein
MKISDMSIRRFTFILAGVFFVSFSLLSFELVLTRILSVLFSYHFVFLAISLALLGIGVGGICVYFLRSRPQTKSRLFLSPVFFTVLFSLFIPLSAYLLLLVNSSGKLHSHILLISLILLIPFIFGGMILAEIFYRYPSISGWIYGMDLAGASAAALVIFVVLNTMGGLKSIFFLSLLAAAAALLLAGGISGEKRSAAFISSAVFLIMAFLLWGNFKGFLSVEMPVGVNPEKEIHQALYGLSYNGKIVETRWSAFGRTDLIEFEGFEDQMLIFLDGTAGSPMYRFSGNIQNPGPVLNDLKSSFSGYFPFLYLKKNERENALIIGPGGGRDILLALMGGVEKITAVEVNPDLVKLVRKYSWYNGGIYNGFKNISVEIAEGRNFLKRRQELYDIIMLSLPITASSRSLEGYALTENYLFTTDSIKDYFFHLSKEGSLIVVCHGDVEISRMFTISITALGDLGFSVMDAMKRIYMIGTERYPTFVLKRTPLDQGSVTSMVEHLREIGIDPGASYFPFIEIPEMRRSVLRALGNGTIDLKEFQKKIREQGFDISPVSDNNPFFYKFEPGLPESILQVFWVSFILAALVFILPIIIAKKKASGKYLALFSLLGLGFMLVEISLIQKFILYLGRPSLSLAVILFSLLIGAGFGSLSSARIPDSRLNKSLVYAALSVFTVCMIYSIFIPFIFNNTLGAGLSVRLLVTSFLLILLGFFMGFPFPMGIRILKELHLEYLVPWMWSINGALSVLGSVLTIMIGIKFGFTQALLAGGLCYLFIMVLFVKREP